MIELLHKENRQSTTLTISKIDFETTRLFLEKKVNTDKQLTKLTFSYDKLYYNGDVLLDNVLSYDKTISTNFITVSICIKKDLKICQDIVFKIQ